MYINLLTYIEYLYFMAFIWNLNTDSHCDIQYIGVI